MHVSASTLCIFAYKAVYTSVIRFDIHVVPWLPSMQGELLLPLCWHWFSWWGNKVFRMRMWQCRTLLFLQRLPLGRLSITASKSISNYMSFKIKNCWRLVDAHFQNLAETVHLPLMPIQAANTAIILNYYQLSLKLPDLQDQKSLMLHWHSLSRWGNEDILHWFDYTGSHYIVYESLSDIAIQITRDA